MKSSILLAAAILVTPIVAIAENTPRPVLADHRVREVNYSDQNVIAIRSAFRTATQIEFAQGETI